MKYQLKEQKELQETCRPILVYDGNDNEYSVHVNNLGELIITAHDGAMLIEPAAGNQIIISTRE